jgi:hypothetical protein
VADNTSITLFRGAAATTSTTLYTSPTNMAVCITNIAICNDTAGALTATLNLGGIPLISGLSVAANTTTFLTPDQIIYNGETITGLASSTSIDFHIAGYEVY